MASWRVPTLFTLCTYVMQCLSSTDFAFSFVHNMTATVIEIGHSKGTTVSTGVKNLYYKTGCQSKRCLCAHHFNTIPAARQGGGGGVENLCYNRKTPLKTIITSSRRDEEMRYESFGMLCRPKNGPGPCRQRIVVFVFVNLRGVGWGRNKSWCYTCTAGV